VVSRSLVVSNQAELDALDGCERINGDLELRVFPGIDETPLLSLRVVAGVLSVYAAGEETPSEIERPLDGLRALEIVPALSLRHPRPGSSRIKVGPRCSILVRGQATRSATKPREIADRAAIWMTVRTLRSSSPRRCPRRRSHDACIVTDQR
jgi:hypothetical protein